MNNIIVKRAITFTLAILMIFGISAADFGSSIAAPTMDEINRLKSQAANIAAEKDALEEQIADTENEKYAILAKKQFLDEQIALTIEEIELINEQIALYEELIIEKELELEEAQRREDEQLARYKERVRAMEEYGSISYFAVVFDAASFSDLLARIDFVFEIMNYDEELYHDYIEAKEATLKAKEELEAVKAELEDTKAELEDKKIELEERRKEADDYIAYLESTIEGYEALYAEADAAEAELWAEVDRLLKEYEEEKRRQEEEEKKKQEEEEKKEQEDNFDSETDGEDEESEDEESDNGDDSGETDDGSTDSETPDVKGYFIWPAPASYIVTSQYGMREHPIYGGQRFHYGVDIGASRGSSIVAADGGTVITAYKHSSYGWFVMLDHGNGYVTLYAHMDSLYVSAGDVVQQGDVLGPCGSTGTSNGPHLHFEVRNNGNFENPLSHLSGYSYQIWE